MGGDCRELLQPVVVVVVVVVVLGGGWEGCMRALVIVVRIIVRFRGRSTGIYFISITCGACDGELFFNLCWAGGVRCSGLFYGVFCSDKCIVHLGGGRCSK
jgi:hypothetical protein